MENEELKKVNVPKNYKDETSSSISTSSFEKKRKKKKPTKKNSNDRKEEMEVQEDVIEEEEESDFASLSKDSCSHYLILTCNPNHAIRLQKVCEEKIEEGYFPPLKIRKIVDGEKRRYRQTLLFYSVINEEENKTQSILENVLNWYHSNVFMLRGIRTSYFTMKKSSSLEEIFAYLKQNYSNVCFRVQFYPHSKANVPNFFSIYFSNFKIHFLGCL